MHVTASCGRPRFAPTATVVLSVISVVALITTEIQQNTGTGELVLDICVAAVSCALLPAAWRWPAPVAPVLAALTALSFAATTPSTNATLVAAATQRPKTAGWVALAGVAGQAVFGLWRPMPGLAYGWWLVLTVVAYAALVGWGTLIRIRQALIESLTERARRAEAEQGRRVAEARVAERAALAREMHDVLAHRLSLVATYAGALEYRRDSEPAQVARAAGVVREGVHQALSELREVISVLREDTDQSLRPQPDLADLVSLIEESRTAGADIRFDDHLGNGDAPAPTIGRTGYRIVQEGLTNARKHAAGQPVHVVVDGAPGSGLRIEVRNPASGTTGILPGSGTGLIGLTERVRLTGGTLDHELTESGDFRLHAWLPWPGDQ